MIKKFPNTWFLRTKYSHYMYFNFKNYYQSINSIFEANKNKPNLKD